MQNSRVLWSTHRFHENNYPTLNRFNFPFPIKDLPFLFPNLHILTPPKLSPGYRFFPQFRFSTMPSYSLIDSTQFFLASNIRYICKVDSVRLLVETLTQQLFKSLPHFLLSPIHCPLLRPYTSKSSTETNENTYKSFELINRKRKKWRNWQYQDTYFFSTNIYSSKECNISFERAQNMLYRKNNSLPESK